ncbi:MAG: hypothetical protein JWP74_198 [Marmoricola sp.]|nr:hypothetical protein [Marmoricola sp.]
MPKLERLLHSHHPMTQAARFLAVGGTGLVVNLLAVVIANEVGPAAHLVAINLPATSFNVRWYHVYATVAFLIANAWNFQLNRSFTFRTTQHARWIKEYWPSLVTGLVGLVINLVVLTLLLHPSSVVGLSTHAFDDSGPLRTRLYWAQFIALVVVTPVSFVINKFWTFGAVLGMADRTVHGPDDVAENVGATT